jgi:hypothetical protein
MALSVADDYKPSLLIILLPFLGRGIKLLFGN